MNNGVTVAKLGRAYFVTWYTGGIAKRWNGNREELIDLQFKISKVLDTIGDTRDGKKGVIDK